MNIQPLCKCGRKLAPIDAGKVATSVSDRTCRKCKARWRVIARPVGPLPKVPGSWAYFCELTAY